MRTSSQFAALLLLLSVVAVGAQTGAENFDKWWTPALEAITAAPQNHKVLFENDDVRVLEVNIPAHTREPLHVHRYPPRSTSIHRPISSNTCRTGPSSIAERGRTAPCGGCRSIKADFLENVDNIPLHAIRVELKKFK